MGQTVHLRLIRDRFIAGHSSCELRRYLDNVPPETPIRDVVDRCRVWESHADPEIRWISKPSPDPIYPAYVVGDSDNIGETIQVAAVTKPKSNPDQLEDMLRRLLASMAAPVPVPASVLEVPTVEKLLQRLVVNPWDWKSCSDHTSRDSRHRDRRFGRDPLDWIGMVSYVFHADESFPFMLPGWRAELTPGGFIMISPRITAERRQTENSD